MMNYKATIYKLLLSLVFLSISVDEAYSCDIIFQSGLNNQYRVCEGSTLDMMEIEVIVEGADNEDIIIEYSWYSRAPTSSEFTKIEGASNSYLTLADISADLDGYEYYVEVFALGAVSCIGRDTAMLLVEQGDIAGESTGFRFCAEDSRDINLYLAVGATNSSGTWTKTGGPSNESFNLTDGVINLQNKTRGLYEFTYTIDGVLGGCSSSILRIMVESCFDLALRKTLITQGPYIEGESIQFDIEVYNQSMSFEDPLGSAPAMDLAAYKVIVQELIPAGLLYDPDLNDGWSNESGSLIYTINSKIPVGESEIVSIFLLPDINFDGSVVINEAELSFASIPAQPDDNADDNDSDAAISEENSSDEMFELFDDIIGDDSSDPGGAEIPADYADDEDIAIVHLEFDQSESIPTLGEWGLIILTLLMLNIGLVALRTRLKVAIC